MMTDQANTWVYEPFGSPVDVNLSAEGAQWEHYLSTALGERVPHGSFAGSRKVMEVPGNGAFEYVEYEARDSGLRSKLWVTVQDGWALIAGNGPQDDAQVTPWVEAVLAANARMADEHPKFRWIALVGPAPSDQYPGMGLTAPATVGPLELRPGGVRHVEYVRSSAPSVTGVATFQSWPVIVEGIASGYITPVIKQCGPTVYAMEPAVCRRDEEAVMRRVVTGQGADGRSLVVSDGPAPQTVVVERLGGSTWEALWQVALPPASPSAGGDPTGPFTPQPAPGTASFGRVTLQPDSRMDRSDLAALFGEVEEKLPGFAAMSDPARAPGMHAMDTLDLGVVVSGRAVLVLDSGEVELGPGDCVVQQGSWHRWRIPFEEPCVLVGVSLRPGR